MEKECVFDDVVECLFMRCLLLILNQDYTFGAQCNVNVGSSGAGLERLGLVLGLMGALFGCKRV